MFKNILVVCIGNICRSPLAEGYLKQQLPADYKVYSAGLGVLVGKGADSKSLALAQENGLDIDQHVAQQLNESLVQQADLILVMENFQKKEIENRFPFSRGKVFTIGHWQGFEISDPYKKDENAFRKSWELIQSGLKDWIEKIR